MKTASCWLSLVASGMTVLLCFCGASGGSTLFTLGNLNLVGKSTRNSAEFHNYSNSRPFWTPEFSSEFYFSDRKMCSRQFATRSLRFGILSRHWFFQFHESENFPAISIFWPAQKMSSRICQPVDPTMLNCVDIGIIPGKAILPTI